MNIFAFFSFMIIAAIIALFSKRLIEETFPLAALSIIIVLFCSGFMGTLVIGLYLIWFVSSVGIIYIIYQLIINFRQTLRLVLRPGIVVFVVAFIIFVWWHRYDAVNSWDELSQWALAVKNSFYLNTFANYPLSNKGYADYPPAAELFHYFWVKTCGEFKDSYLYVSMNVLIVSFLISTIQKYYFKNTPRTLLAAIVILVVPYALYPTIYNSLLVDPLIGIVFGWVLYTYYINRTNFNKFVVVSLSLGVFILPIIKQSGLIFAIVAVVLIGIDTMTLHSCGKKFRSLRKLVPLLISSLVAKLMWTHELSLLKIQKTWNFEGMLEHIQNSLLPWQKIGFINFYKALINYRTIENTSQTVYHFGPFTVSAIVWIVFLAVFLTGILFLYKWRGRVFFTCLFIGAILYIIFVSFLYLKIMGEGEAAALSSFGRYINTYLIAILLLCVSLLLNRFATVPTVQARNMYVAMCVLLLIVHVPLKETPLVWMNPKYANEKIALFSSKIKYDSYINQLNNYLQKDAVLHNFYGDIASSRYNLTPIKVTSHLWQSESFEWYRTYAKEREYTHVFFESTYGTVETEEFKNNFSDLFLPGSEIKDYSLYEVVWQNDIPMMRYITQLQPY